MLNLSIQDEMDGLGKIDNPTFTPKEKEEEPLPF